MRIYEEFWKLEYEGYLVRECLAEHESLDFNKIIDFFYFVSYKTLKFYLNLDSLEKRHQQQP